jgi:UDP-N-acetyl-2-amino-2-deoxyglucuronate dehydrogenase
VTETGATKADGIPRHGFGIIGAGVIGAAHAQAIALVKGARLVAVADVAPGRAKALADEQGCAAEDDIDALLARADIDVVAVCVPSGLHAEVGARAAAAGKHLVIEKPIDVTLEAADRLIGAARRAGVAMTVISQHRFDTGLIELRRLLDQGALGALVLGEASTKWYRTQGYYDSAAWRGTWGLDGGSLMNQGVHYVDLLLWAMGPVTEVTAVSATLAHRIEAEDVAVALVRFASGALGSIVSSTAAFPGSAQRLEVYGTEGTVVIEDGRLIRRSLNKALGDGPSAGRVPPGGTALAADTAPAAGTAAPAAAAHAAGIDPASHAAQIADLLAAIDEGRPPSVTAESARATLEVVCAVYESARVGRTVTIPVRPDAGS